ncbi:Putative sensory transduction regulator [Nakamurella panacisegetis]|uniref:Putative sensory transduction regulator n=1 Tax=Nakamurella panacisegetis TaxID=1090615 RepID=A0A1H0JFT5_9ACTN|nr:YbjN domain-containing protein [Nakamurella panacisegetis]SDO42628.1 Putative sensory transduction regulator [Nakamurella panacisegetis]
MTTATTAAQISAALTELGVTFSAEPDDAFLLTLPGERRHRTLLWLLVGSHELLIESFVCRAPDESREEVYRFLLQRNAKLRTVAYSLDLAGDIHLVGRLGLSSLGPDPAAELNTVLGVVLTTSDEDFNQILERGFAGAIRREWAWRTSRGHSLQNLQAFRHMIENTP